MRSRVAARPSWRCRGLPRWRAGFPLSPAEKSSVRSAPAAEPRNRTAKWPRQEPTRSNSRFQPPKADVMLAEVRARLSAAFRYGAVVALALQPCGTASGQEAAQAPAIAGQILVMSDLHFDPMADPQLVDQLAAAEPELWSAVLHSSHDSRLGRYGRDNNWMLPRPALRQMTETLPKPALVLISGDFLPHGF